MSAADPTRPSADALEALLAEEAASTWLPAGAVANTTAVALGDLADTADLPRESLRTAAAPKRRVARLRRAPATPGRTEHSTHDEPAEREATAATGANFEPVEIPGAELAGGERAFVSTAGETSQPVDVLEIEPIGDDEADLSRQRRRGVEERFELPRGPRPDVEDTGAPLELERGPRPQPTATRRLTPAPAAARPKSAPALRLLEPEPLADVEELVAAQPSPLQQLLEEIDAQEAVELAEPPRGVCASVGEREERADAPAPDPTARRGRRVLVPAAVAAIAAVGALAWPTPQAPSRRLPDTGEAIDHATRSATDRSSELLEQLAREARQAERKRSTDRAAKQRAAAQARRERAARAAGQRRTAPAPARTTTSAPVVAAEAPRTSTSPTKRTAPAPVCHSDLGPC
jgi:hypothetical protein